VGLPERRPAGGPAPQNLVTWGLPRFGSDVALEGEIVGRRAHLHATATRLDPQELVAARVDLQADVVTGSMLITVICRCDPVHSVVR
jgi:hypothetical protein